MATGPDERKSIPVTGWKLRFDAPPPDGALGRAAQGDILSLFRAWDGADREVVERRRATRYSPAESRAWVGWWRHGHFLVSRAEFVNLSEGGALMKLSQKPPTSQPVWVCLGTPAPVDSVQARVLDSVTAMVPAASADEGSLLTPGSLVYVSRLEFHAPCPATFFAAAGRREGGPTAFIGNGPNAPS
jgi:hypothetical protein